MEEEKKKSKFVPIWVLAVYSVLLYGAWTCYHFFVLPDLENAGFGELATALLNEGLCKGLIWAVPAALLMRKYSDTLEVSIKELFTWKKEYAKYLLIFPIFAVYILLGLFAHKTAPDFSVTVKEIVTVVFVGVTEELVFRGWLLNATSQRSEYGAIAVNAVMFLAIHFPRWISEGVFVTNMAQLGFVSIIALSVVFSLVFLRTKNIILPITLHMFWDFLIFLLY